MLLTERARPAVIGSVLAAMVAVASACGVDSAGDETTAASPETAAAPAARYDCFGVTATADELEAAPSVADLGDHPGFAAFAASTDDVDQWRAVEVDDEHIGAIRALDPPDINMGEVRDHERMIVALAEGNWRVVSAGPCSLRGTLPNGLGATTVLLDPDAVPTAADTSLSLWVVESACASGQVATGRVTVLVEETPEAVRLMVGVKPLAGASSCQGNPPTPVTVELDEPLGNRRLMDVGRLPAIEVPMPDWLAVPPAG